MNTGAKTVFRAIALMLLVALPAASNESGNEEIAVGCGECSYTLHWNPQADATFYELYLADPLAQDGRRLAYKGPSTHVRVIVRDGQESALLRSCNVGGCSGFLEIPLIPERNGEPRPGIRFAEPVDLLHELGDSVPVPSVGWPTSEHRALSVDVSAAGQPPCAFVSEEPRWVVGTRMLFRLSDDLDVVVVNRNIIEHPDGRWTWTGDIAGEQEGVVTFTTDACGERLYASIDSKAGQFAVQPSSVGEHVGYRVVPGDTTRSCDVLTGVERTALFGYTERESDTERRWAFEDTTGRSRAIDVDFSSFESQFGPLATVVGQDRDYDIARFVPIAVYVELLPGEPVALDLHRGHFEALKGIEGLAWYGCVAGDPSGTVRIDVVWSHQIIVVNIRRGDRITYMQEGDRGSFRVIDAVLSLGGPG